MSNPTTCTRCGASVVVRDGTAYTFGIRHSCTTNTAPAHVIPDWVRESVEYEAFVRQVRV